MTGFTKPVPNAPLVSLQTGRINLAWLQWFLTIDSAVGGNTPPVPLPDVSQIAFDTPNTSGRIASVESRVNVLETLIAEALRPPHSNVAPLTFLSSNVAAGSGGNITSATPFNVTNLVLPAGTWLMFGNVGAAAGSGTITQAAIAWISQASATLPTFPNAGALQVLGYTSAANDNTIVSAGAQIVTLPTSTTIYLSGEILWTVAQPTYFGFLGALKLG